MYSIRLLKPSDIATIVNAFASNNWPKPRATFQQYLKEQEVGDRVCWIAHNAEEFAGYVTLTWRSKYQPFSEQGMPEIMDLNVLPSCRNLGIGSSLLATAEVYAATRGDIVGLGVGLYADYGSAQRLYIARGFVPDGRGVTYNYKTINPGKKVLLYDDLVLWFEKFLGEVS